jgi:hypothetical protein
VTEYALASALPGASDLPAYLDLIQANRVPVARQVILDREPVPAPGPAAAGTSLPSPEFLVDDLNEVVLRTTATEPAILVLADMMAPGWQAEVDGQPSALLKADFILRAVALPAGEHEVRFRYQDPALRRGLTLTLVGLACVLALLILPRSALKRIGRVLDPGKVSDQAGRGESA